MPEGKTFVGPPDPPVRGKHALQEWLHQIRSDPRMTSDTDTELNSVQHWLYMFVYWLEGQDLETITADCQCRYHVFPARYTECIFEQHQH